MSKNQIRLLSIAFVFVVNLEGFLQFLERLLKLNNTTLDNMTTTHLIFKLISIVATFGLCYYFLTQLNLLKEKTIEYANNKTDELGDAVILLDTIRIRQEDFLWNYIESLRTNQSLPIAPTSWLTDLEILQNETIINKRKDISDAIKKQFGHSDFQTNANK